jgi:hypothetical protein
MRHSRREQPELYDIVREIRAVAEERRPSDTGSRRSMTELRRHIDRFLALVVVSIMAILVVTVLWQVSRYLFPQPSPWTEEMSRFLLIWVTMLGAAYLTGQHGHIAIDLVSITPVARWSAAPGDLHPGTVILRLCGRRVSVA